MAQFAVPDNLSNGIAPDRFEARRWRRVLMPVAVLLIVLFNLIAWSPGALAHAVLEGTQPVPNEVLPEQPEHLVLTFNEPVSPVDRQFRLFDSTQTVTTLGPEKSGNSVIVPLPENLPRGSYVLAWRVISADGHPISGALPFAIGETSSAEIAVSYAESGPWVDRLLGVLNGITYACFLVAVGVLWFWTVFEPGIRRRTRPVVLLTLAGLIAMALAVPVTVARQQAETLRDLFSDDWIPDVTRDAWIALAVATAGAVLLSIGAVRSAGRTRIALLGAGSIALLGSLSVVGHTRIVDPRVAIVASNLTHVIAGAVWLGGLVGLVLAFRRRSEVTWLATTVARFSGMAAIALTGVLISGTVSSALILRSLSALFDTSYGRLLLIKIGLVLIVCGLGAWNRFRLVPVVTRDAGVGDGFGRLRRIVVAEATLLLMVALVTGFLVNLSPRVAADEATHVHGAQSNLAIVFPVGEATASGELVYLRDRRYTLRIVVRDATGAVIAPYETPGISLMLESLDVGPLPVELRSNPDGTLFSAIVDFPFAGAWTMSMSVRFSTFESATGQATITVP